MKSHAFTILAILAVFGCELQGSDDPASGSDQVLRAAKLDLAGAVATAEATVTDGVVVEAEFEIRKGEPVYEVALLVGDEVVEVWIDSDDGGVLGRGVDPEDLDEARGSAALLGASAIGVAEAIAAAERAAGGRAFEIEIAEPGYEVAVLTDAGAVEVLVDRQRGEASVGRSGAIGVEEHDDDDDGDD